MVPAVRIHDANNDPERADGAYVLYWMIAHRRPFWNHALEHAVAQAQRLGKPLLIFEPLRLSYEWASDRLHQFVIEGMRDNAEAFARTTATYVPWVELTAEAGKGLLACLAARACLVVTDEFPCFFLPRMVAAAAARLSVRVQTVDANGLFPLRASDRARDRAVDFRRLLHKELRPHLAQFPLADPLKGVRLPRLAALPPELVPADLSALLSGGIAALPIDHGVGPGIMRGGWKAAQAAQDDFFGHHLADYAAQRSDVETSAASGFSPYLHFGHLSPHQVVAALWAQEGWSPERLAPTATASREGWWGMSANAEAFIDQLLTWRELGYHFCFHRPDYASYESLPVWARASLDAHSSDQRTHRYTLAEFATSQTHDPLWNAAQRQLLSEGRMHNYLRMLWAKKILEWSASPRQALATMIELNNRYALDGRNPNSYSGIMWCLGRFDRPWAPQRPIFGCIRYMSSDNTARKMRVKGYLARYAGESAQTRLF
jgi:deoxyribodipyrimidine photo-lyase